MTQIPPSEAAAVNTGDPYAHTRATDPFAIFRLDPASATPPFRQLHELVIAAIGDGSLLPGQRLPTVRALAAHLSLAANTVAGAYRSLEAAGAVEGRGRAGTFVRLGDDPVASRAREIARDAAAALTELGIAKDRALHLLTEAYDAADAHRPVASVPTND